MMDAVYLHIKPRPIDLLQVLWYSQNTLSCITRVFEKESNAMLGYTDTVCSCYVNTSSHLYSASQLTLTLMQNF